ncbi:hypothetical protein M011DRAFT_479918 [Sporormia fimetaria CBS 119925]|uniref:Uncharacterized protein n=1 Tax=Sporormia fimetaria CBS 119925 TaxID=1340428 RepID=A0A6A6V449_9PLEO|nr:hypothetical protein M011DRAFT_479918 [Sporormia fimetaria CBS 119925]
MRTQNGLKPVQLVRPWRSQPTWPRLYTSNGPILVSKKPDGSEEEIPEEDLYRYTSRRFLSNEAANLAARYRKFNLPALVDAAVQAAGEGAQRYLQKKPSPEEERIHETGFAPGAEFTGNLPEQYIRETFVIGPSTEEGLWRGERETMEEFDRGPWGTPLGYMAGITFNEFYWAKAYAKPRPNPFRPRNAPESPDEYLSLLRQYLRAISHLAPPILVDPHTLELKCVTGWHSTKVAEPFFQPTKPMFLLSAQNDELNGGLSQYYYSLSRETNNEHWSMVNLVDRDVLTDPISHVTGAWESINTGIVRQDLIRISARWEKGALESQECPIKFTDDELQMHKTVGETIHSVDEFLRSLHYSGQLPYGGVVLPQQYEEPMQCSTACKELLVAAGQTESEKEFRAQLWPYEDRLITVE